MARNPHEAASGLDGYEAAAGLRGLKQDTPVEILGIGVRGNVGISLGHGRPDLFPGERAVVPAVLAAEIIAAGKGEFVKVVK